MTRSLGIPVSSFFLCILGSFVVALAASPSEPLEYAPSEPSEDVVGDTEHPIPASKSLSDTIWIADWTFDLPGGGCTEAGWTKLDNRILNDGSNYWIVDNRFSGSGGIAGNAASLKGHDLCWECDGYDNNWDYSIILKYKGAGSTLSFHFLSDTEPGYDFITVEADSAGASEARLDYGVNPRAQLDEFRVELYAADGLFTGGVVSSLALPTFGTLTTVHEVYIRFSSDGGGPLCLYPSFWGTAVVVDNIAVTGGLTYSENFEAALNPNVTFANTASATAFGEWARLFHHITDNDKCSENTTCAWLWTDPTLPANFPDMSFGPGGHVIRPWLDNVIVSPWVSLASAPQAAATSLRFRRFGGNRFSQGLIVQNWSVRARIRTDNTDTPAPGDSADCLSEWGHANLFNSLNSFGWVDVIDAATGRPFDMSPFIDSAASEIQVRFRVIDWQFVSQFLSTGTGPGPYLDRVRIGRQVLSGPVIGLGIDTRSQAQDCFPTVQNAIGPGEHFSPDGGNRFGTCAFSQGKDLGSGTSANLITGDSITLASVTDARGAGGIKSVRFYGAIVSGPHVSKAPAPYTLGANGFFEIGADSVRNASGVVVAGAWFVDLDDTYLRGGDVLRYYWGATDGGGGFTSEPRGITTLPVSVPAAEAATRGLYEVNALPKINWSLAYLARVASDAHGDLDPTPGELAASTQANCILYSQHSNSARRSGDRNRTYFMYTLDQLGYRGSYDVYDVQGHGSTNNQLGGRANVAQASGYALIIEDDGRSNLAPNITTGTNIVDDKINQAQWYRSYLAQGATGLAGTASLWVIGENTAFERSSNALFATDLGLATVTNDQGLSVNPDVGGVASFTWATGSSTDFTGDAFSLNGGCPAVRAYDAANAAGTAVRTHSYRSASTIGGGAIVMNKNAAQQWNTIWQGFAWFDIRHSATGPTSPTAAEALANTVLSGVLPVSCLRKPIPTGIPDPEEIDVRRVTALHPNVPNPFNPTTTIRFDLAQAGRVELRVFDVAGHLVRTLASGVLEPGRHTAIWNGLDTGGAPVASGVYFYRLEAPEFVATRKLVLLE